MSEQVKILMQKSYHPYLDMRVIFLKMGQTRPLFCLFCPFLITISIIQIEKGIDGVLGMQTRGRRMVGADDTKELWWRFRVICLCGCVCPSVLQKMLNNFGLVCLSHFRGMLT